MAPGGAPKGNRNSLKHGEASGEALALRKEFTELGRMARQAMAELK